MERECVSGGTDDCTSVVSVQWPPTALLQRTESTGTPVAFSLSAST